MRMSQAIAVIALLLGILAALPAVAADRLRVGVVPQFDLRRIDSVWTPLLERLSRQAGLDFQLDIPPNIPAFEKSLMAGEYDLAYMNPYHAVVANKRQGYVPLLRDHGEDLYGLIVVAKDSPITSVAMLDGKVVAFPSPNAMGAALVPRAEFARKFKIAVTEKYVKSHSSAYLSVVLGEADAGGGILATYALLEPSVRDRLRILYETEHFPPHPLSAHPRLPAALREQITEAFLALAATPEGAPLVREIPMKQPGPTRYEDYAALARLGLDAFYVEN